MNVLIAYGSKTGGTSQIAERIGETLRTKGFDVDVAPAHAIRDVRKFSTVIIGGALYAGRWYHEAARFVVAHGSALRERRVWLFSSGPLDDSAQKGEIPPTPQVEQLLKYIGADGHVTFGGRLAPDARGFIASAMAKEHAGDWRDMAKVDAWAQAIAERLESEPARAPRPASAFSPLPSVALIVSLCFTAGLSAVGGGLGLVMRPDGSLLQMPLTLLKNTPFDNFLVPGLLLLIVIGVGNTLSAILHLLRHDFAPMVSVLTGSALVVWILVQMAMLWSFHPVQVAYLLLGAAIMRQSIQAIRVMSTDEENDKPQTTPTNP